MKLENCRLQFITHYTQKYSYTDSARIALEGGCKWVQLRMKDADDLLLEETALVVQKMCREYGATFIIDDNVALAKKIGADGVHLGKNDMPVAQARKILGENFIIGATVNSFEDVLPHLQESSPDYFGCGPYRFTSTKQKLAPILGLEGYRSIVGKMRESNICIPIVAIGGICKEDVSLLMDTGIDGIALSGSVLRADDPIGQMRLIKDIINGKH
jgi:thiamine-phosphate pyrophosphorylase